MYKIFAFLTRREGMAAEAFVEHYEDRHIPLILRIAPAPVVYRRRYLTRERPLGRGEVVDFDAMTELWFESREAYRAWMAVVGTSTEVAEDEARFLDRERTRAYVVEEYETAR